MATRVQVRLCYKINMGNYETADIDITVADDARPDETHEQAFNRVYNFVEKKLSEKVTAEKNG